MKIWHMHCFIYFKTVISRRANKLNGRDKMFKIFTEESMNRKLVALAVAVAALTAAVASYAGKTTATTNLIVGRPAKGMYCADPAGWVKAGYKIYVWHDATPVKAQVYDANGYLMSPANGVAWKVTATGETGSMTLSDSTNKVYTATPKSMQADIIGDNNYEITYTADGKTFKGVVRRWNSDCDGCHTAPPSHALANAGSGGVSKCRDCHALGEKMKTSHYNRVPSNTTDAACYSCHPSPCYSGVHVNFGIGCVQCHGTLASAATGQMKVPGMLGFPKCDDCHVSPYVQNSNTEFKSSVGHGRTRGAKNLCITCHNSMHMEEKPTGWGDSVNNCEKCHTVQPTAGNMGNDCGRCHVSSINPHIVKK